MKIGAKHILSHSLIRKVFSVLFMAVVIFVVWRQREELSRSLELLFTVKHGDFLAAIPFVIAGMLSAALAYKLLAFRELPYRELVIVEFAAACVNRLVPSGLGGMGIHGLYLHRRRHTSAEAAVIASVNNLMGSVVHFCLLGILLALGPTALAGFHLGWSFHMGWILLGIVFLLCLLLFVSWIRKQLIRLVAQIKKSLSMYRKKPGQLLFAAASLSLVTMFNVLVFWLATRTMGLYIGLATLLVIYTVGVAAGAAVPTPGGLGGVEAGLLAGLLALQIDGESALAAVLAFRFATFWLPLLVGIPFLWCVRRKKLI